MITLKRTVKEYATTKGQSPYREWLRRLDTRTRARIEARVFRIEQGNLGDTKIVGHGVWEVRIDFGPGYRVYFGLDGREIVILLLGGDKGSQKRDIKKAQEYWAEYWRNDDA
jgi:putative addiction module killer protein